MSIDPEFKKRFFEESHGENMVKFREKLKGQCLLQSDSVLRACEKSVTDQILSAKPDAVFERFFFNNRYRDCTKEYFDSYVKCINELNKKF